MHDSVVYLRLTDEGGQSPGGDAADAESENEYPDGRHGHLDLAQGYCTHHYLSVDGRHI